MTAHVKHGGNCKNTSSVTVHQSYSRHLTASTHDKPYENHLSAISCRVLFFHCLETLLLRPNAPLSLTVVVADEVCAFSKKRRVTVDLNYDK